jgi:signal transduction histidine kinase
LRRSATVLLSAITLVLVLASAVAAVSSARLSEARARLADRLDPAAVLSAQLLAALVDQETGVRGYVLTEDPQFLTPWETGQADELARSAELARLVDDEHAAEALLADLLAASERWRTEFAEGAIAAGAALERDQAELEQGRVLFEAVRAAHQSLTDAIGDARSDARRDLQEAARWLTASLTALVAALAAAVGAIWVTLHRQVLQPLAALVDDARVVADGRPDHLVPARGAAEFAELADAMDAMRVRVAAQLQEVEDHRIELARSNAELEQFAYVASHDLQEPLRKVASFCQMLQRRYRGQLDDRADQYIDFAVDGAKRMQELINDLLTFSRVGRSSDRLEEVALDAVAERAVANLSRAIEDARATVEVAPLPVVRGERTLLVGLFQNLIGNAVKFRGVDPPVVTITVDRRGDVWELGVADNGIGIDPQYRDRVFVIFQRLHARDDYEGTGIGLAMCRKIVEFHGGRLWIDDERTGPGTTFRFTLPVLDAPGVAPTPADAAPGVGRIPEETTA